MVRIKSLQALTQRLHDSIIFLLSGTYLTAGNGELAEWSKAHDWKSCLGL